MNSRARSGTGLMYQALSEVEGLNGPMQHAGHKREDSYTGSNTRPALPGCPARATPGKRAATFFLQLAGLQLHLQRYLPLARAEG